MQRPRCSTKPPNTLRSTEPSCRAGSTTIRVTNPPIQWVWCWRGHAGPGRRRSPARSARPGAAGPGSSGGGSPAMLRSSSSTACSPVSANGTRSEDSEGVRYSAKGMSSQLTTATSAGTRRWAAASALSTPIAMVSLCTKMAVIAGPRSRSSRVAAAAVPGVQSASTARSSPGSIPASRSASSYPCRRLRTTWRRNGPVTVPIEVWPSWIRCWVASRAPSRWLDPTSGTPPPGTWCRLTAGT